MRKVSKTIGKGAKMKILPVTKVVDEYSAEELLKFRRQFAPVAQQYRKRGLRMFSVCVYVFLLCLLCMGIDITANVFQIYAKWINILLPLALWFLMLSLFAGFIFFKLSMSRVKCPACHNRVLDRPVQYCPDCGSSQIEAGNFWGRLPKCNACGKKLFLSGRNRGKFFAIRYCTHCGVLLDEKGLLKL
jgi:hypothetical protein